MGCEDKPLPRDPASLSDDTYRQFNAAAFQGPPVNLSNPADPVTITNLPFDASGNLIPSRLRPRDAGFGVANAFVSPRTVQAQIRFQF